MQKGHAHLLSCGGIPLHGRHQCCARILKVIIKFLYCMGFVVRCNSLNHLKMLIDRVEVTFAFIPLVPTVMIVKNDGHQSKEIHDKAIAKWHDPSVVECLIQARKFQVGGVNVACNSMMFIR